MPTSHQQNIPHDIAAASDYRRYAKQHLSEPVWHYIDGGSADEITKADNRTCFDAIKLRSRVLCDLTGATTESELLGQSLAYPFLIAPMAYQTLLNPLGELATVMAAGAQDIGFVLSTLASTSIEDVAQQYQQSQSSSPLWFGLYVQTDWRETLSLIERAQHNGYQALMISVDAPVNGLRNREQRAGFSLPSDVCAVNLINNNQDRIDYNQYKNPVLARLQDSAPTWELIEKIINFTSLPVIIKGILDPQDALKAKAIGASAIVVSNHGGRVLDGAISSIDALPSIRQAVGQDFSIMLDSGITRGSDIFKAIALGANSVLIGRVVLYALATAGPMGVAHALKILKDEFELTMGLCGAKTINDITEDKLLT